MFFLGYPHRLHTHAEKELEAGAAKPCAQGAPAQPKGTRTPRGHGGHSGTRAGFHNKNRIVKILGCSLKKERRRETLSRTGEVCTSQGLRYLLGTAGAQGRSWLCPAVGPHVSLCPQRAGKGVAKPKKEPAGPFSASSTDMGLQQQELLCDLMED